MIMLEILDCRRPYKRIRESLIKESWSIKTVWGVGYKFDIQ